MSDELHRTILEFELTPEQRHKLGGLIQYLIDTTVRVSIVRLQYSKFTDNKVDTLGFQLVRGYGLVNIALTDELALKIVRELFEHTVEYGGRVKDFLEGLEESTTPR